MSPTQRHGGAAFSLKALPPCLCVAARLPDSQGELSAARALSLMKAALAVALLLLAAAFARAQEVTPKAGDELVVDGTRAGARSTGL